MRAATAIPRPPSSRLWRATPHGLAEQLGRLRVVVVVALLGAAALPEGGPSSLPAVALLTTVYVAAQLLARALLLRTRRLSSERRWLVPIALDIAVTTVVLPLTGGARSPLVLIYLLPAVMAGGVLGLRAALGVVTAEAAAYAVGTAVSSTPLTMAARSSLALVLTLYTVAILAALVHRARSEAQGLADEIAETVRAVGRGADLATSLSVVGTKVGALTGATMAVIHVRPAGGDVFEPHWSEGVLTGYLAALEAEGWSRVPSTPPASVHLDRDSSATGPWAAWLAQSSLGSVWLIPIVAEDQLVGRIDLGFVEAHPGLGDMLGLVQTLLYPAGLAVIRDARTQALRHRAEALARLQAGALRLTAGDTIAELLQAALELIRELTGAQDAAVAVWDEHDDLVELVTAGTEDAAAGPAAVEVLEAVAGSQELRRTAWPRGAARSPGSTGETVEPCLLAVPIPHLGDWRGAFSLMGKTGASAFTVEDEEMGQAIGAHVAAVLHLHRALRAERDTHDALLAMLVEISDAHEHAVEDHSQRVHAYARMIAEALGVPEAELAEIANGGLLHDIGKLGVPDSILQKPGPLDDDERVIMMAHSQLGAEIVVGVRTLASLSPLIRHHHERWDGAGYPDRLSGEAIPLGARIVAVADTIDAITTARPYRAARSLAEALVELQQSAGTHFDPAVVAAAVRVFGPRAAEFTAATSATTRTATLAEQHSTVQTAAWRLYARLGQELRSVDDLPLLATRILEVLEVELGLPGSQLGLLDESGTVLEVVASRGDPLMMVLGERRARGHGLMWAALTSAETLVLADAEADPRYTGIAGHGHYATAFVPLLSSRGPQGVLVAHRPAPQTFDRLLLRQLEAVAVPVAETLTVARLVAAVNRPHPCTASAGGGIPQPAAAASKAARTSGRPRSSRLDCDGARLGLGHGRAGGRHRAPPA